MRLKIHYRPLSIGKFRLLVSAVMSLNQLRQMGFSDKDVDEVFINRLLIDLLIDYFTLFISRCFCFSFYRLFI